MRKTRFLFFSLIFALLIVSSCQKEDPVFESEELVNYVEAVVDVGSLHSYISAPDLLTLIGDGNAPYIIDIRKKTHYNNPGHIPGAVNVAPKDILAHVQANVGSMNDDIVVVCYSGQSAAFCTSLLKLAGYSNAKSLLYGMTSWNPACDSWTNSTSPYYANFLENTSNDKPSEGDLPDISTGFDNGEDILLSRIGSVLTSGFGAYSIDATIVTDYPDNYFIVNYWPTSDYLNPGHITGAYNYVPGQSLTTSTDLKTLPTDKIIVVYCSTGQNSAFIAAYLGTLGYNVKSLKSGANSMFHGDLPTNNWTEDNINDYNLAGAK